MTKTRTLIVGAHGAVGSFALLKLYGVRGLSVLVLPSEVDSFLSQDKKMVVDRWYPSDKTVVSREAFVRGACPSSEDQVGVFTSEEVTASLLTEDAVVFVTSKTFHYDSVIETVQPALGEGVVVNLLVNGLKPEVTFEAKCRARGVESLVTRAIVMGGTHFTLDGDARLVESGIEELVLGHWNQNQTPSYQRKIAGVAALFREEKLRARPEYESEFRALSLDKVLANLINPTTAFIGGTTGEFVENPILRGIATRCFENGIDIGLGLGLSFFSQRDEIIEAKLGMYRKAGTSHLSSMGQDALRAALYRRPFRHENEHIGEALAEQGDDIGVPAPVIAGVNALLRTMANSYNKIYRSSKDAAAHFLIRLWKRNRHAVGLSPDNESLREQFTGLEQLQSVETDLTQVTRIRNLDDALTIFEDNLRLTMDEHASPSG